MRHLCIRTGERRRFVVAAGVWGWAVEAKGCRGGGAQRGGRRGALLHLARHLHGQSPRSMFLIQLRARIRIRSMIRSIRCSKKGVAPTSSTALTRANGPAATAQGPRRTLTERRANPSTMDVESDVDVSVKPSFPTKGAKASKRSSTQSESNHVGNARGVVARATTALCAGPWPMTRRSDGLRSALLDVRHRSSAEANCQAKKLNNGQQPSARVGCDR